MRHEMLAKSELSYLDLMRVSWLAIIVMCYDNLYT